MPHYRRVISVILPTLTVLSGCMTAGSAALSVENATPEFEPPTHVILMVSDGIGFNGWLAADYYQGLTGTQSYQTQRPDGTQPLVYGMTHDALNFVSASGDIITRREDAALAVRSVEQGYDPITRWQDFQNTFANDFAPLNAPYTSYTDSAAAGTALMTGRKTSNGRINMDWSGEVRFKTIAQIAMDEGLTAGAVASVMASHATPASVIAHNVARGNYEEIFNEMVASDLDVIMGGGHPLYDSSGNAITPENEEAYEYVGGSATLAKLTSEVGLNGFTFIDEKADFEALANGDITPARVVGIARTGSTLQASREDLGAADTPSGMAYNPDVPNLATMSLGALNVLSQDKDGFFLMIEGGAVDWMGHANNMPRFIEEQIDFNLAVDAVIDWVEEHSSWDETLLIVTADHETGGIWGEGTWINSEGGAVASNPSDRDAIVAARFNPSEDIFRAFLPVQDRGAGNIPGYQFASGNHTNELVPLWVLGKGAERFEEFTRTDVKAADLWGDAYGWDGRIIDNTNVFDVMKDRVQVDE
ncbi:MAG: alkaline phosphatase [Pseudomonadota bacterium]